MDVPRTDGVTPAGDAIAAHRSDDLRVGLSFEVWVAEVGGDLLRFAQITTRNVDPAGLVQDALVVVFARWSMFSDPSQADAYARRVILNSQFHAGAAGDGS